MQHAFELPQRWEQLVVTGRRRDADDFAVERRSGLMVSARALELLRSLRLDEAEVVEVTSPVHATDEDEAAAEQAWLAARQATLDEQRIADDIDRAERARVKAEADAARDAALATAYEDHRAKHPEGFTFTGDIDVLLAAIGKPVSDAGAVALFALPTEPLEHEVTLESERETHETWSSRTEGFSAATTNGVIDRVTIYPAWNGPLTRSLVEGVNLFEATALDLAAALGEPDRFSFGGRSRFEYDLGGNVLHFGMLATTVDRITVLPQRKKKGKR